MTSVVRARRSALTVPATSERMLMKAQTVHADEIVIDLEDSVPPSAKTEATRRRATEAVSTGAWIARTLSIRVNAVDTVWFEDDVSQIAEEAGEALDCLVIPKVESADDVAVVTDLLHRLHAPFGLEVQIESARGLMHVEQIAAASPRLEALVFGPGDFAASLGMSQLEIGSIDSEYPGDQWHYVRSRIAVAAHAYGLDPVDGPYASLDDMQGLRESARRAHLLGFVGKWAIHPRQIPVCNEVFTPTPHELERAERVLATLAEAQDRNSNAAALDGVMIDEATRKLAMRLLARNTPTE